MYKTLLIDPPWKLCTGGKKSLAVHTHYPVQTKSEIIETISSWLSDYKIAEEAHLYLWTINSYSSGYSNGIIDAIDVCKTIGFKPITNLLWCKPQNNPTPYGLRGSEICIFATRHRKGNHKEIMYGGTTNDICVAKPTLKKSLDWFVENRSIHSRKPHNFYQYIENRSRGPYLELYARNQRNGWTCLGNESNKYKKRDGI
jgi:N6-adenosine-specific RNA methylase IME4